MKPYLVHKTWVDLDHVLAIEDTLTDFAHESMTPPYVTISSFTTDVIFMFRDKRLTIELAQGGCSIPAETEQLLKADAQKTLNAFIEAWKNREGPTVPQSCLHPDL